MTELFRIKPLEWEWFEDDGEAVVQRGYKAETKVFYAYVTQQRSAPTDEWTCWRWYTTGTFSQPCPSPEEGKQLAEQHWQEYIKQALMPVETEQ